MNVRTGMANYKCKFLGKQEVDGKVGFRVFSLNCKSDFVKREDPTTVFFTSNGMDTAISRLKVNQTKKFSVGCRRHVGSKKFYSNFKSELEM